ncbi:MAG: dTDP-4-dehydrorhamnose 3,5-epimerase family protein [Candidatus Rokubacteria bacterium]|nr:dTDP-4-dehydrorhamnose 3,5-epimerase family protein [Candidatus Rokubacteria bacterium]
MTEISGEAKRRYSVQVYGPRTELAGVQWVDVRRLTDDGGSFTELGRLLGGGALDALREFTPRQVNYSEIEPGVIKAFHLHARQTDVWYVPPSDRLLMVLADVRKGSPTEGQHARFMLGAGASRLVRIPPGVAHGVRNLGTATGRVIYFTDLHFSSAPAECDEGRLPWDYLGPEIWEPVKG